MWQNIHLECELSENRENCKRIIQKYIYQAETLIGNGYRSDKNRNKKHTYKDVRKIHSHM